MAFAQSKVKITTELLERLDAVAAGAVSIDTLPGIKFSAERLRNVSPGEYFMIQGLVAAFERDYDQFWACFAQAFEVAGYKPNISLNATLALIEMGRRVEAVDLLRTASPHFNTIESLEYAADIFAGVGYFTDSMKLGETLDRMRGSKDYAVAFSGITEAFAAMGISETDLFEASEQLRGYLNSLGYIRFGERATYENSEEWGTSLVLNIALNESAERLFEIEQGANEAMLSAGIKAVESDAFAWYLSPSAEAPRACVVG